MNSAHQQEGMDISLPCQCCLQIRHNQFPRQHNLQSFLLDLDRKEEGRASGANSPLGLSRLMEMDTAPERGCLVRGRHQQR
jgi:hypothetical protein